MTIRDEFLEKVEDSDRYAQEAALTDLCQTHLSRREAERWGPDE